MTTETTTEADGLTVPALATGITAKINGQTRHCEIYRSDLRFFEAVHGPAFHLMNRIRALEWDIELLRAVIAFATGPRPDADESPESFRMTFITTSARRRAASAWIDDAFQANGPVRYAGLALGILGAALAGLPADDARFDDEE